MPAHSTDPEREMRFEAEGAVAGVIGAVEKVVGKGKATAAESRGPGAARWVCLLVDDVGPYVQLGSPWRAQDFPGLAEAGFEAPPGPLDRKLSLYLAHAKQGLGYQAERGDRIIVLTCPRARWPALKLVWPMPPAETETF